MSHLLSSTYSMRTMLSPSLSPSTSPISSSSTPPTLPTTFLLYNPIKDSRQHPYEIKSNIYNVR